ncbi:MAG: PAS domain S-box protein, partial [Methylococcaceae bacterium]|nr:PAS domain S-box protein [Methylococcaceae bacterium]
MIDLFSIKDFIPHGYCLSWSPVLLWLHVISDLLTATAYYSIPLTLIYFVRQRKDFPYPWLAILFAGFIVACGTTHLLSAITIWIPLYWLDGLVKAFTAIISITTAGLMLRIVPRALSLPSVAQLQAEIQQRKAAEAALRESENKLNIILDSVEACIYIKDCNYQYQYVNQPVLQLLGSTLEDITGKLDGALFDKATTAKLRENDYRVIELGERVASEEIITDKDNTISRTYFSVKQPLRREDGSIYGLCGISTDITERKQEDDALRQSRMELQEAQRIAHVGSWQLDMATNHVVWSEELYRIFGLNPELPPPNYTEHHRLFTPDSWERICTAVPRTQETGKPYELELETVKTDGAHGWILARGEVIQDASSAIIGLHGVILDITERKLMEEELKTSEAKFRSIIEVSPVPMALLNEEDFNITFLNPAFVQTFGYNLDDIPTLNDWWSKAYPDPDYRQWVEATWQTAFEKSKQEQTDIPPLELVLCCKNNSIKTVLVSAAAIHHNSTNVSLVILYDITQRKQMEAKLDSIFNASIEGIITVDISDIIISANTAVENIFGYTPEELMGCNIKTIMPPSPKEMDTCSFLSHAEKFVSQIQEIKGLHKNGFVVPLDLSIAEYSIDSTNYFTYIVRDVSLRKYRELQDKEHLNQLAHVTRLGLMGEMASGIAHEVNQPLAAISSYAQVSINLLNTENPDLVKLAEILYKTQQQALRAGQIIRRMREFVKSNTTQ